MLTEAVVQNNLPNATSIQERARKPLCTLAHRQVAARQSHSVEATEDQSRFFSRRSQSKQMLV
jgi:hypothetical protein